MNFIKQTGKALFYFMIFFSAQIIGSTIIIGYHFANEFMKIMKEVSVPPEELSEHLLTIVTEKTFADAGSAILISGVLTFMVLWIQFYFRKKSFVKETGMFSLTKTSFVWSIMLGLGIAMFFNAGLELLPIPEDITNSYANISEKLYDQPLLMMILSNVIAAPIVEELTFRGLMYSRLKKAFPVWLSITLSSVMFGVMHGHVLWATYATIIGIILTIATEKTGSTWSSILAHMVINLTGVVISEIGWTTPSMTTLIIILVIGGSFLALSIKKLWDISSLE